MRDTTVVRSLLSGVDTPGLQYLVVTRDATRFEYHGGTADLATGRPMQAGTTLMAYSMSKTITAAAVLQLVEAKRIGLDDPIARYVESQPYGGAVTIRQLVSHTSGIPNPIPLRWVHAMANHATFDEPAALDAVLRDHPRLARPPGTKYAYSNIGYWLLGRIVERASGEPLTSYVSAHVLRPLGIGPDEIAYDVHDPLAHASGYLEKYSFINAMKSFVIDPALIGEYQGRWLHIRDHYPNGSAFGGLVGSAAGFAKFLQDQLRPHSALFSDEARAWFYAPQQTRAGAAVPMTLGWHIDSVHGVACVFKEGGGGGFHSMMRLYPSIGIGTVMMANATGLNVRKLLNAADPNFFALG